MASKNTEGEGGATFCSMQKNSIFAELTTSDLIHVILSFLDVPDLARWDGSSSIAQETGKEVWRDLQKQTVSASPFAIAELDEYRPTPKEQSILAWRMTQAVRKHHNKITHCDDIDTMSESALHIMESTNALVDPRHYHFYISLRHDSWIRGDDRSSQKIIWQGFVCPLEQGAWGNSTIFYFHLKDVVMDWPRALLDVLMIPRESGSTVTNEHFQEDERREFDGLGLALLVVRKREAASVADIQMLVSTRGVRNISVDNRVYYHMTHRQVMSNPNDADELDDRLNTTARIFPRLVTKTNTPHNVLGLRLVCEGIIS